MPYRITKVILSAFRHKRAHQIVSSMETVLKVGEDNVEDDGALVGKAMADEANKLKGLVRKTAQLMGDRPDLVGNPAICMQLRILQSNCEVRDRGHIEQQMTVLRSRYTFVETVKAGTIGEVSRVIDSNGNIYAMKTINPESKALYEADFNMFNGLFFSADECCPRQHRLSESGRDEPDQGGSRQS
jgi:hypothetical protein